MRYLITGITGFAGPHLARLLLEKGHDVHGVVRTANGRQQDLLDLLSPEELDRITFHYLDLKHYFSVSRLVQDETFDGIYHLAAQSHPPTSFHDPVLTFEENVTASVNLLAALDLYVRNNHLRSLLRAKLRSSYTHSRGTTADPGNLSVQSFHNFIIPGICYGCPTPEPQFDSG